MSISRKIAVVGLSLGVLIGGSTIANAYVANGSFSATCDPVNYGYKSDNHYHYHDNSNTLISVKNNGSGRTATVRLYRSTGTTLTSYNITNSSTQIWGPSVAAGNYKVEAKAASTANCNGVLPGYGNFTFKYQIAY